MARIIPVGVKEVLLPQSREEDSLECRLENDPRFLHRVELARASLQAGCGVPLEDVETE